MMKSEYTEEYFDSWFKEEGDPLYYYIQRKAWICCLNHVRNNHIPEAWNLMDVDDFIEEEILSLSKNESN